MAEDESRRGPTEIWPWIFCLLSVGVLAWATARLVTRQRASTTGMVAAPAPEAAGGHLTAAERGALPISQILQSPAAWIGKQVAGTARVDTVSSDRGLRIGSEGPRLLVLLNEAPREVVEVTAGQTVRPAAAELAELADLPGAIAPGAREAVRSQPVLTGARSRS